MTKRFFISYSLITLFLLDSVVPVSYTHLDVYKRQLINRA